jgi:hypothetical protein
MHDSGAVASCYGAMLQHFECSQFVGAHENHSPRSRSTRLEFWLVAFIDAGAGAGVARETNIQHILTHDPFCNSIGHLPELTQTTMLSNEIATEHILLNTCV